MTFFTKNFPAVNLHLDFIRDIKFNFPQDLQKQAERSYSGFENFISANPLCLERSNLAGHLTASAFITNNEFDSVLLLLHRKLKKWLQPGGHADGEVNLLNVAANEVYEEVGLNQFNIFGRASYEVFDLDIHDIPETQGVPAHKHYDVRFLFRADARNDIKKNHESEQLQWISLDKVQDFNKEGSISRMANKLIQMRPHLQQKSFWHPLDFSL
ncbi:MAG: NUDIX domain-containing protein [Oligoflexales bacterium]|nr:NUDIX domain-containing protein [Oligoflexales bacterium]